MAISDVLHDPSELHILSFIGFLIGITMLYAAISLGNAPYVKISEIDNSYINRHVTVIAFVTDVNIKNGHIFMNVKDDTGEIRLIVWNNTVIKNNISLQKLKRGTKITALCEVKQYKNEMELIANEIEINEK